MYRRRIKIHEYKDAEKSLLDSRWERMRKGYITLAVISACIPVYWVVTGLFIYLHKKGKETYLAMSSARDTEDIDYLVDFLDFRFRTRQIDYLRFEMALFALVDLRYEKLGRILYEKLNKMEFMPLRETQYSKMIILDALDVYAMKTGYSSGREIIRAFEKDDKTSGDGPGEFSGVEVTKVYYLDKEPKKAKCMISSLPLDFATDEILACPHCGNMANSLPLENWLSTKRQCPVCRKRLTIDDCPIVKLRD
ncbi:MAG: hypothetical protein ACTSSH_10790 [Candidatus Heimdallarchaeota archaeon]